MPLLVAERLRTSLASAPVEPLPKPITVSIGDSGIGVEASRVKRSFSAPTELYTKRREVAEIKL